MEVESEPPTPFPSLQKGPGQLEKESLDEGAGIIPENAEDLDEVELEKSEGLIAKSPREKSQISESNLPMQERFLLEQERLVQHYLRAYEQFKDASRDPEEVKKAIYDYIEDRGLFRPTPQEKRRYKNPDLADTALDEIVGRAKNGAVRKTIEKLQEIGRIES